MTLSEQKALVADFLARCNRYADGKLEEYRQQLATATGRHALEIQDEIGHWTAYRVFNEHAIDELRSDVLDHWFTRPSPD